jgi:hypothetical protein
MTTQKKPVVRTSNSNVTGVVVKPNNHSRSEDLQLLVAALKNGHPNGNYTFRVSVKQNFGGKSYLGIICAVAKSQDEAIRFIEMELKEVGMCSIGNCAMLRFQPFRNTAIGNYGYRGSTTVEQFIGMFSIRANRPQIDVIPRDLDPEFGSQVVSAA